MSEVNSYVRNCLIFTRGEDLFNVDEEYRFIATLDGYAVIPMEEYDRLRAAAGEPNV